MRTRNDFRDHLAELIADLEDPRILWQVGAVLLSLLLAWGFARLLTPRLQGGAGAWRVGAGSLRRVVFPLSALLLVVLARAALKPGLPVHLLDLAVPLLGAMAIVRVTVYMLR